MQLKSISEVKNLKGKTVLLRVGFDVPVKNGKVIDDFRIKQGLETIKYLISQKASVIVLNHLGRPKNRDLKFSNKPIAKKLSKLLGQEVPLIDFLSSLKNLAISQILAPGKVIMMENLRFNKGEEQNDLVFAKKLSRLGDIYVNDAFSVSHRQVASISGLTKFLPGYAGLLLEKEIINLNQVLESKAKPKVAIIGGAKLETKVKVIENLLKKMDFVLVGGAIANNFIKAKGFEVGQSLWDAKYLSVAKKLVANKKLILPVDLRLKTAKAKSIESLGKNDVVLDLGPKTIALFQKYLAKSKLVVWNGPLGYFEDPKFKKSSEHLARFLASRKSKKIVGGGETVEMINDLGLIKKFDFVSTGGGAMLEYLEGKLLPGIKPLFKK